MRSSSVQPRMLFVTSAANVATSRKAGKVGELHLTTHTETEEELFLGGLTGESEELHKNPWSIVLSLNGKPTKFEIDILVRR